MKQVVLVIMYSGLIFQLLEILFQFGTKGLMPYGVLTAGLGMCLVPFIKDKEI